MSTSPWQSRVVPAQLSFLAIYNPSLGPTDDTFGDQLVFYFSRAVSDAKTATKKTGRDDAAGGDALRSQENEQLRQIGLAQGMIDFAKTFSNGEPVDSIETEKSRIVLHELESGWWILASIDITRLPSISSRPSPTTSTGKDKSVSSATVEYSSREVSPPALLIAQLLQAHQIFCLHHGPSLSNLLARISRDKFCSTLSRFWTKFSRTWDVLLHGNPAADVFSGLKLASGGELGFGVGEEEWGSGERDVLEDLARRTGGLVDMVVSRFGEPDLAVADEPSLSSDMQAVPWLGGGRAPIASDGLIFGGLGAIGRSSLRDVSLWMREIYMFGEQAYGVRDNPLRERRKRRRRSPHGRTSTTGNANVEEQRNLSSTDQKPTRTSEDRRDRARKEDHETTRTGSEEEISTSDETEPGPSTKNGFSIPPPIVSAAAESLRQNKGKVDMAVKQSDPEPSITAEGTTMGIPDQYMKYLTFGLSTLAKQPPKSRPSLSHQSSTASDDAQGQKKPTGSAIAKSRSNFSEERDTPIMMQLDPMPDGETLKSRIAAQKRQENEGYFVIGLKGDLNALPEDVEANLTDGSLEHDSGGSRTMLRTLHIEVTPTSNESKGTSTDEQTSYRPDAGVVGHHAQSTKKIQRLRVLLYVKRPFMYCLLFKDRTSSLQLAKLYVSVHRNLGPIYKPLLSSTSVAKVTERIEETQSLLSDIDSSSITSGGTNKLSPKSTSSAPIFDLIYDPALLTLHTSIPNVPEPGTLAAEGFASSGDGEGSYSASWTRVDALNVHSQILDTLVSVQKSHGEIERTSKTSRGWWVVWMKLTPSNALAADINTTEANSSTDTLVGQAKEQASTAESKRTATADSDQPSGDVHRIAFLVRKASDAATTKVSSSSSRAMSGMFNTMTLGLAGRPQDDPTGGASAGWGPGALTGGIGVDTRKYVEGLLSLNR